LNDDDRALDRNILGIVVPIALVVLTLLPLFLYQDRLPDPLATHWGAAGRPNDTMSFNFLVVFEWAARRNPAHRGQITRLVAVLTFIATTVAVTSWRVVTANLDVEDWTRADAVGVIDVLSALALAALVAAIAVMMARRLETAPIPETPLPSAGLKPGARAVWIGTARSWWAWPLVLGIGGFGVYQILNRGPMPGLVFVLIGLVMLIFTSVRVVADRRGVHIGFGPIGWPRKNISLGRIRRASKLEVIPMEHGGWGYRGSLRFFGRAAIVLRGGDGLQLDLADDKVLTITVDNAEEGAGLLNDLVGSSTI
jgi:hypothetical protein